MKNALKYFLMLMIFSGLVRTSFALLKVGDKLVPFSLKGTDDKTVVVTLENGRLTVVKTFIKDGQTVIRKSFPDAILIDFWATWCVPCRASMPYMQKFFDTYRPKEDQTEKGLELFGVALDAKGLAIVKPFYQKLKFTYPMLADPGSSPGVAGVLLNAKDLASRYEADNIPVVYIFDSKGTIVHAHVGFKKEHVKELEDVLIGLVAGEKK